MFLDYDNITTILLIVDNKVVGFVGIVSNTIGGLFVDPKHQSKGYGSILLKHAIDNYKCNNLEVFIKNKRAYKFYKANGFINKGISSEKTLGEESYLMELIEGRDVLELKAK